MPITNNRILSLDVFRGITILLMILVNSPGTQFPYPILKHAFWNGCTLADLVFPSFLFIVGITTVISLQRQQQQPTSRILLSVFKRALYLFLIGLMLNAIPHNWDFSTLRYFGVLQRIAICYAICSVIYLTISFRSQFVLFFILIFGYWLLMTMIPVPGIGANQLTKTGSWSSYVDQMLFSSAHLLEKFYDPEGFLSTLPSIATTLIGVLFAHYLLNPKTNKQEKLFTMIFCSWILFISGWLWNYSFPINKALWTSSYVLWAGGYSLMAFSFCYLLIDVWGYERWTWPFKVLGVNALFIYVVHILLLKVQGSYRYVITNYLFSSFNPANAALIYAQIFILINFLIAWFLYKKKIFIKL